MTQSLSGWGGEPWGGGQWGGGIPGAGGSLLRLIGAFSLRENVIRLQFNDPVFFPMTLEPGDASDLVGYEVVTVGGVGMDGQPIRAVSVAEIALADVPNPDGTLLDLSVDRMLSHYPCQYMVSVSGIESASGVPLDTTSSSASFFGLRRQIVPKSLDAAHPNRDVANPQVLSQFDGTGVSPDPTLLGTLLVDSTGDYATDSGLVSLRKRILRRLLTRTGGFAHLPDYGVGVIDLIKHLATSSVRAKVVAEAEKQIAQEPDVLKVKVKILSKAPGAFTIVVLVKTRAGQGARIDVPVQVAGGTNVSLQAGGGF